MDELEDYRLFACRHLTRDGQVLVVPSRQDVVSLFRSVGYKVEELRPGLRSGNYDVVALFGRVETADMPGLLAESLRLLKHGGLLLFSAANDLSVLRLMKSSVSSPSERNVRRSLLNQGLQRFIGLISRTLVHRHNFRYHPGPHGEHHPRINPLDIRFCLESLGAKIVSYQPIEHIPNATLFERLGSRFFAEHMDMVRIVARKGARYERH